MLPLHLRVEATLVASPRGKREYYGGRGANDVDGITALHSMDRTDDFDKSPRAELTFVDWDTVKLKPIAHPNRGPPAWAEFGGEMTRGVSTYQASFSPGAGHRSQLNHFKPRPALPSWVDPNDTTYRDGSLGGATSSYRAAYGDGRTDEETMKRIKRGFYTHRARIIRPGQSVFEPGLPWPVEPETQAQTSWRSFPAKAYVSPSTPQARRRLLDEQQEDVRLRKMLPDTHLIESTAQMHYKLIDRETMKKIKPAAYVPPKAGQGLEDHPMRNVINLERATEFQSTQMASYRGHQARDSPRRAPIPDPQYPWIGHGQGHGKWDYEIRKMQKGDIMSAMLHKESGKGL